MTTNAYTAQNATEMLQQLVEVLKSIELSKSDAAHLVPLANAVKAVNAFMTPVHAEIEVRAITNNQLVPGAAVKDEVKHRVWNDKDEVEKLAREQFGAKAFTCALLSPAQMETKLGDEGKALVAMCSSKPAAGKKVVY